MLLNILKIDFQAAKLPKLNKLLEMQTIKSKQSIAQQITSLTWCFKWKHKWWNLKTILYLMVSKWKLEAFLLINDFLILVMQSCKFQSTYQRWKGLIVQQFLKPYTQPWSHSFKQLVIETHFENQKIWEVWNKIGIRRDSNYLNNSNERKIRMKLKHSKFLDWNEN